MVDDISIEDTRLKGKRPGLFKGVPTDGSSGFFVPRLGQRTARIVVPSSLVPINHLLTRLRLHGRQQVVWNVVHG